ncbi:MAG: hypothetical protein ACOCRO_02960 [Halanaerobiales bacterium]
MIKYLKNQNGYALIITLALILFIALVGTAYLHGLMTEVRINGDREENTKATYAAYAGLEHGLFYFEEDAITEGSALVGTDITLYNDGSKEYYYTFTKLEEDPSSGEKILETKGMYTENGTDVVEKTIKAKIVGSEILVE